MFRRDPRLLVKLRDRNYVKLNNNKSYKCIVESINTLNIFFLYNIDVIDVVRASVVLLHFRFEFSTVAKPYQQGC